MRRRLSIAISLLGSPNVLLLDEPTTGLDPSTRNEIWSLISSFASPERAVIITTHMMIEADTLCSRIAIVAKGNLKVIGSQQHLKVSPVRRHNSYSYQLLQLPISHVPLS
jgi:ABC-type multidrug transport system ATPase subunit